MTLIDQYRKLAAGGYALRGLTVLAYADEIGALIRQYGAKTLLDYGCGAGDAYRSPHKLHERWGVKRPTPYDPAFPKYARPVAGEFDGVFSIDVLEHLADEDEARHVVHTLFGHAEHFVFASHCSRPAKKSWPDGTNLHSLIRPAQWWEALFAEAGTAARLTGRNVHWQLRETP